MKKATRKKSLNIINAPVSDLEDISYRVMMGEYIIYFRGRIIGGIVGKNKNNQREEFPNILQKR